ncbi:6114_t:CDS:2 [Gigaspora margarita]|uniref:tRNA (guanine-N(1)-)-methyltransferase n=1 Tax=Gigaspora margarita TaxID=4874 RepID=A0ABN7UCX7_GIGMA|nr:6114_t:CDS:2 [Gigaspora margarita]
MGGEIPALAITDALIRAIPGAIHPESYQQETFANSQLDFAAYTRPEIYNGLKVPPVLLSGNHKEINEWRKKNREKIKKILTEKHINYEIRSIPEGQIYQEGEKSNKKISEEELGQAYREAWQNPQRYQEAQQ